VKPYDGSDWESALAQSNAEFERARVALLVVIGQARRARCSWAVIGRALGISRQAARSSFERIIADPGAPWFGNHRTAASYPLQTHGR
jgi:hypothetical protein